MREIKAKKADIEWWLPVLNKEAGYGAGPRYVKQKNGQMKGIGKGFAVSYDSDDNVLLYFTDFSKGDKVKRTQMSHPVLMTYAYFLIFGMIQGFRFAKRKKEVFGL